MQELKTTENEGMPEESEDLQSPHEHAEEHFESKELVKIFLTTVIFFIGCFSPLDHSVKAFLFILAYLIIGTGILSRAVVNIFKGQFFDENFLMSLATLGALSIGQAPEAVMVMLLYGVGEFLQDSAVEKSKKSVSELMDIRPDRANVIIGGEIVTKAPQDVKIGDLITLKTGEKVPLDGVIKEGAGFIDTSALTGESALREIFPGDDILSGCVVTSGYFTVEVLKEFGESTVSKILKLVEYAGEKKSTAEKFITKFAKIYTPIVVLLAVGLVVIPTLIFHGDFYQWFTRALTFLVISCPCALLISVPLGFFAGLGCASRKGILIKGSKYVETLAKVGTVIFDKTGTLTKGCFGVEKVVSMVDGISETEILKLAASLEQYSNHPIAKSFLNSYKGVLFDDLTNVFELAGCGIRAEQDGVAVLAGNRNFMIKQGLDVEPVEEVGTVCFISKGGLLLGYVVLSDELKDASFETISGLNKMNILTVMLSGDNRQVVDKVACKLGIKQAFAMLLPQDKVEKLEEFLTRKNPKTSLLFAGDGINDAPVLRRADIGVAMGGLGSDSAIEAADAVIMDDNPLKILTAIKIAKRTLRIVKQNICIAIFVKVLFLILGACGVMTMWGAVFSDVGVTIIAVLNSLRAFRNN